MNDKLNTYLVVQISIGNTKAEVDLDQVDDKNGEIIKLRDDKGTRQVRKGQNASLLSLDSWTINV